MVERKRSRRKRKLRRPRLPLICSEAMMVATTKRNKNVYIKNIYA